MSNDFRTGIDDLTREVEARYRTSPGLSVALIERAAGRRRRGRAALVATASAAAALVLAVSATAVLHRPAPTPPARNPEVSRSSAAPTPSASAAPDAARLPAPKVDAAEPDAWVMTDDTWDRVGPGWVLTLFSTMAVVDDGDAGHLDPAGVEALFLVAPDATTYRLVTLPDDAEYQAQIMWWDPARRTAWLFAQGLGESWDQVEVDLTTGSTTALDLAGAQDPAPVLQVPDGWVLWADSDPFFPTSLRGLYWQLPDGSVTTVADEPGIEGDAWWDPSAAGRLVHLAPGAAGGHDLVTHDVATGSTDTRPLGSPAADVGTCSLRDVRDDSVLVACADAASSGERRFEVTASGEWQDATDEDDASTLVQRMLQCGSPVSLWSPYGRELSGAWAAGGWRDVLVLPVSPGSPASPPSRGYCGE